jgi:hypothetical protein
MEKSKIIEIETKKLLDGVEEIENRFNALKNKALDTITDEPLFFDNRSIDCIPLITNCTLSLGALPASTPPTCKIQRKQYEQVIDRLNNLRSSFSNLQDAVEEAIAGNITSLATITNSIVSILKDFVFMKLECKKIKRAMDL